MALVGGKGVSPGYFFLGVWLIGGGFHHPDRKRTTRELSIDFEYDLSFRKALNERGNVGFFPVGFGHTRVGQNHGLFELLVIDELQVF